MPGIELAQEKWARKVMAAAKKWASNVSSPETFKAYVSGIAEFTGLSEAEVSSSMPARNYREFQAKADQFTDKYESGVKRAAALRKWARNYVAAFKA